MDINFDAAIHYINMGKYEAAVEHLEKAIAAEESNGSTDAAIECTCVLGELLANMGETERARAEFDKVIEYCKRTNSLGKQQEIAQSFINEFEASARRSKSGKTSGAEGSAKSRSGNEPNTTQSSVFMQ